MQDNTLSQASHSSQTEAAISSISAPTSFLTNLALDTLTETLAYLTPAELIALSPLSRELYQTLESNEINTLWSLHIKKEFPSQTVTNPSRQAYNKTAALTHQDNALAFILASSPKVPGFDYSTLKKEAGEFKNHSYKERAAFLTGWNEVLGLHQLQASTVPVKLQGLSELTPAVIKRLTEINKTSPITHLEIRENYLPELPPSLITFIQSCTQLQKLDLGNNQLQSIPKRLLQNCAQLNLLYLNNNQLQSLPEILLQNCVQLTELDLVNNQLQSLPEILLQNCTQLEWLYLRNNQLKIIPEILLQNCAQLKKLGLVNNQLQSIPERLLQNCAQLTELGLSNNQLQNIPERLLQNCAQLKKLGLSNNPLQSIPERLLQNCSSYIVVHYNNQSTQPFLTNPGICGFLWQYKEQFVGVGAAAIVCLAYQTYKSAVKVRKYLR